MIHISCAIATHPHKSRLRAIDAARGLAMMLVFLAHFVDTYATNIGNQGLFVFFHTFGMFATPTFMIISGISIGYLYSSKNDRFKEYRIVLIDRGLFFILIGHPLISVAYIGTHGSFLRELMVVYVTDVVGICLIVGPLLILKLKQTSRLLAGLLGYLCCWVLIHYWQPSSLITEVLMEILIGTRTGETGHLWYSFPVIPWFCVYLCCSVVGEKIHHLSVNGDTHLLRRLIHRLGWALLLSGFCLIVLVKFGKYLNLWDPAMVDWLTVYRKIPPGPSYLLFLGGGGMLMLYCLFRYGESKILRPLMATTEMLGKVSFFAFVLQYYIFILLLSTLDFRSTVFWPIYFVIFSGLVLLPSYLWYRLNGNRFLSFRYNLMLLRRIFLR